MVEYQNEAEYQIYQRQNKIDLADKGGRCRKSEHKSGYTRKDGQDTDDHEYRSDELGKAHRFGQIFYKYADKDTDKSAYDASCREC